MSKLLYKDEHLACYNYQKDDKAPIEGLKINATHSIENIVEESEIIFVIEGRFSISYGEISDRRVNSGQMFVLRQGYQYKIDAEADTFIMIFRINSQVNFCDRFSIQQLYQKEFKIEDEFNPLIINNRLSDFLSRAYANISDGLLCTHFLDLKRQELFFLLRAYYSKEDLARMFHPLLNNDQVFSNFIYDNHYKVKNIQQLVALSSYSVSAFNKRFKKSFGISPYKWMKDQRAKRIFHEINNYTKNFKVISEEYGFSSLSQFNDFCKVHFGLTPGEIRKKS
ncbi:MULTISPECIES: helix-turn-helix transcriptional regulator [unclassified Dysgonomonas]|uniref:helix-turn-helix transcriptional regulator n=1 Tax=unclassified Dysgonomonas TaxID=2630389 RepID=UPI00068100C9|nr:MULTISPECIES: helix-turn-helix transcriptional regulator [unclassified Dysgonomonas]MBD8346893.1 helix-turn-helix transcriptional regulator [Dysgonomonas sp. HGC4]MBF0575171.1 helix-turn-helix transcriptional regulator [Dysgonomonas sp. GY617]